MKPSDPDSQEPVPTLNQTEASSREVSPVETTDVDTDPPPLPEDPPEHLEKCPESPVAAEPARLAALEARLSGVEQSVRRISELLGYLPPQVRRLGEKVDGLVSSIAEPRLRNILLSVLQVHDLAERSPRGPDERPDLDEIQRNRDVVAAQLRMILENNGLQPIPTEGPFDPELHHAVKRVPVEDPALHGRIVEVVRSGFRNAQQTLRYAEVVVGHCGDRDPSSEPQTGQPRQDDDPQGE